MCGIFGLIVQRPATLSKSAFRILLDDLFLLSESRGKEAAGLAISAGDSVSVLKRNMRGKAFARLPEVKRMISEANAGAEVGSVVLMGHTRMVTNGDAHDVGNNQPVFRNRLACIHNGIITNDEKLWQAEPDLLREHGVDTEVFLALAERGLNQGQSLVESIQCAIMRLIGANSFAVIDRVADGILLATTNGSLYCAADSDSGIAVFASERFILEQVLTRAPLNGRVPSGAIFQVHPENGLLLSASGTLIQHFRLRQVNVEIGLPSVDRRIVDFGSTSDLPERRLPTPNHMRLQELERVTRISFDAISRLKRCAVCLLPETFPFLHFDKAGVCSVCRSRSPTQKLGKEALMREFASGNGAALSCLAPISGGRDSCFGLHFMVREMGLRPIAYTYDWGMVTDLARRNISRMCGALGIEHVLVSADIARKREFIRMNVLAWLRRPHLGTVPLFMAGDKQFFFYAEKLRRQMRLDTIVFSMNPLERTDFKLGFCGIDEGYEKQKHYDPSWVNKLRIAGFYAREYLSNPAYLNSSLLDTLGAYASYYLLPKGYKSLFDYIPWHEKEVEGTLLNDYQWERAADTKSTWRIGDGTAAFYNYIYLRVAGFTENDTFRSNQIREGLIDRESAQARIDEENQPRLESCAAYFDAIGVDAVTAIRCVNAMPRLYE